MERNVMKGEVLKNAEGRKMVQERKRAGHGQAVQRAFMTAGAIVGAVLIIGAMVSPLCAQSYPDRPIKIVPHSIGSNSDVMVRMMQEKFAEGLGQPVVVEPHAGAAGNIAWAYVAKARPDGYTIGTVANSTTINPSLYKNLNYDVFKDFAPISLIGQSTYVLVVRSSLPINSLKELVAYAKANPGKLNYAAGSTTSQLATELLKSLAKINMVCVLYKGTGPAMIGLLSGETDVQISNPGLLMPHIQSGKMRPLAVLQNERVPVLPNVPTAKEAGIDNWEVTTWYGLVAPAGTPRDIVNRLNAQCKRIAALPDYIEKLRKADLVPFWNTPEQFSEFLKAEVVRWAKVVKEANIPKLD